MDSDATPVTLDVAQAVEPALRGWVESLGWQVVDAATAELVPPALALTDVTGCVVDLTTPTVLLIQDADDPVRAAQRAGATRPTVVLRWPADRDALPEAVGPVRRRPDPDATTCTLRVAGAGGGVGTTTVALALGGLLAWRGRRTLVICRGDVPSPGVRTVRPDVFEGGGGWRAGTAAPGVPGLRVVGVEGGRPIEAAATGADATVVDAGCDLVADVLVLRRDAAGLAALEATTAGVVVAVDSGPVHPRDLLAAAAGRLIVTLPYSARVARAGLARRVPAGLPGAWLRLLAPVVRDT